MPRNRTVTTTAAAPAAKKTAAPKKAPAKAAAKNGADRAADALARREAAGKSPEKAAPAKAAPIGGRKGTVAELDAAALASGKAPRVPAGAKASPATAAQRTLPAQPAEVAPDTHYLPAVEIGAIRPSRANPRAELPDLEEMRDSILQVGILQPLEVQLAPGHDLAEAEPLFDLIYGHRRLAAADLAGLDTVPVIVKPRRNDRDAALTRLIENLQRSDLTPLDEARAYRELVDVHKVQQKTLAARVGRNPGHVTKRLALLKVPESVQAMVNAGELPIDVAVELSRLPADEHETIMRGSTAPTAIASRIASRRAELEREEARAKVAAELSKAGMAVVNAGGGIVVDNLSTGPYALARLRNHPAYDVPADHFHEPCHAARLLTYTRHLTAAEAEADPLAAHYELVCTAPEIHLVPVEQPAGVDAPAEPGKVGAQDWAATDLQGGPSEDDVPADLDVRNDPPAAPPADRKPGIITEDEARLAKEEADRRAAREAAERRAAELLAAARTAAQRTDKAGAQARDRHALAVLGLHIAYGSEADMRAVHLADILLTGADLPDRLATYSSGDEPFPGAVEITTDWWDGSDAIARRSYALALAHGHLALAEYQRIGSRTGGIAFDYASYAALAALHLAHLATYVQPYTPAESQLVDGYDDGSIFVAAMVEMGHLPEAALDDPEASAPGSTVEPATEPSPGDDTEALLREALADAEKLDSDQGRAEAAAARAALVEGGWDPDMDAEVAARRVETVELPSYDDALAAVENRRQTAADASKRRAELGVTKAAESDYVIRIGGGPAFLVPGIKTAKGLCSQCRAQVAIRTGGTAGKHDGPGGTCSGRGMPVLTVEQATALEQPADQVDQVACATCEGVGRDSRDARCPDCAGHGLVNA